ncbi:MAG: TetR/AcrR family transcriptional regulator [Acidimicrobiales bacterium]
MTEGPKRALGRQAHKRQRIVAVAMDSFASDGYEGARVEAIASQAGVSKGAVFSYFGSKAGLFLAAYETSARSFSSYLDAPAEVLEQGFFATVMYWLEHTTVLVKESWVPYRVSLLGNYCSDLRLRREITEFLLREDPYGTQAFVQYGIARGEVRKDIDMRMVVSLVDWLMDRCQDAVVTEELDPGLFGANTPSPEERRSRFTQFIELLQSAIGTRD